MPKRFGIPIGQVTRTANRNHSRRLLFSVMRRGPTCSVTPRNTSGMYWGGWPFALSWYNVYFRLFMLL